ncbi:nuclear transport factor 2 family protein [Nonomuraea longicatena]|uniref:Nuclear transport factor 2 family protein n=1 Tax=Nonomuraea longicatena TaxID=83682 RepID=A0ABN1P9V9_9ACTN
MTAFTTYTPTDADVRSVLDWFGRYDALVRKGEVESMADMAMFPLNNVTDDAEGNGKATPGTREEFVRDMAQIVSDVEIHSTRTPHFLSASLVFVVTEAYFTVEGQTQHMRYGDLLVKNGGVWYFQTMVQGGWG